MPTLYSQPLMRLQAEYTKFQTIMLRTEQKSN